MAGNKKQPQHDAAGFPVLSFVELRDCLLALGISVTTEDISKPSAQTTQMIYGQLVDILMGIPMESMEGPRNSLLGMMEHRVRGLCCADTVKLINRKFMGMHYTSPCFSSIGEYLQLAYEDSIDFSRDLASVCGIKTLVMTDLLKPEPARTRTILCGIMNFAKWRSVILFVSLKVVTDIHRETQAAFQTNLQQKVHAQTERYDCLFVNIDLTDEQDGETT